MAMPMGMAMLWAWPCQRQARPMDHAGHGRDQAHPVIFYIEMLMLQIITD